MGCALGCLVSYSVSDESKYVGASVGLNGKADAKGRCRDAGLVRGGAPDGDMLDLSVCIEHCEGMEEMCRGGGTGHRLRGG